MIKDWEERKLTHKLYLFYSNRRPEDASYLTELQEIAKRNPSFPLIAIMTEPEKSSIAWNGERGLIDENLLRKYVPDVQLPIYYISGMAEMVDVMKSLVGRLGVDGDHIRAEEFSGFKMGEHDGRSHSRWKSHLIIGGVAVALLVIGIVHIAFFSSMRDSISLNNPVLYILTAVMLLIIPFKFKHLSNMLRGKFKA